MNQIWCVFMIEWQEPVQHLVWLAQAPLSAGPGSVQIVSPSFFSEVATLLPRIYGRSPYS
ncbi:MAG: hypothetical protein HC772_01360 [Leptolyngbyaceae cyanobacterium CRU_2_3]|nr:hypothetical protein [Leptolyngbyaceae cyanobacterium CRU_2_3]